MPNYTHFPPAHLILVHVGTKKSVSVSRGGCSQRGTPWCHSADGTGAGRRSSNTGRSIHHYLCDVPDCIHLLPSCWGAGNATTVAPRWQLWCTVGLRLPGGTGSFPHSVTEGLCGRFEHIRLDHDSSIRTVEWLPAIGSQFFALLKPEPCGRHPGSNSPR